ncbi:MAG TPA: NADH-ubiquinone oxidoreductase-F iron-sulfur binding region domain-containing protein [Dehalococcoidia bacterium]|nr:NADH-ubiquinone oxidoreductase-F iron-sulfur binding region domain-containing protein [Dehalococcoidia bacterium]
MPTYSELLAQTEPSRRRLLALDRPRIAVCVDTSSIAVGAIETLASLREAVASSGIAADVDQVGGNGLSFANPVVEVRKPDGSEVIYQKVQAADAAAFIDSVLTRGELYNQWLLGALEGPEGLKRMDDYGWWALQERRLIADMSVADPESIDDAIACGAYSGLQRALGMTQEEVIAEVSGSKLSGRSGGFFPTGRKWDFLRTSPTNPKAMVCNADEGDPGAWVNRMTLENDPHALIEGMMIGGYAAGAVRGYIYIREEYPLGFTRVQKAVDEAYERGVLGPDVLGTGFSFEMKVVRGAGSYVCGEESGLIASIEDGRGMPKIRPPFPAASGVFGEGSNVNNVQSYHGAAWLMRYGLDKYVTVGTERNPGTMMFSLSGQVQRAGCFEFPFGTSVHDVYEVCGGGAPEGHRFKALQPGGPLLGVIPELALGLTIEPETFREGKAVGLGGGGFVFLDERACIVDLCTQYEWFLEDESCGRCTTCHGGTQRMVEILKRIQRGGGRESDIGKFRLIADTLRYSNCFHGQFAPSIIVNMLDWFAADLEAHIYQRRCPAQACTGLIRYEADRDAASLPEHAEALSRANDLCLSVATGEASSACLACLVCSELLPDVVRVVDAFESSLGPAPELISVQPAER